jgi:hypothetical protein
MGCGWSRRAIAAQSSATSPNLLLSISVQGSRLKRSKIDDSTMGDADTPSRRKQFFICISLYGQQMIVVLFSLQGEAQSGANGP